MQEIRFELQLSNEQCQLYYAGKVRYVQVLSRDGRQIRFPARALLPFISYHGVQGEFVLRLDDDNRLLSLRREA